MLFRSRPSSIQTKPPSQISLPPKPPISSYLARRVDVHDSELSIFDAERYFNEGRNADTARKTSESCDSSTNPRESSVSSADGYARNWRSRSFRATPTASSEASWNSQSGLLSNPPGSVAVNVRASFPLNEKRRSAPSSPSLAASRSFFGRNCPCYGRKAVDVDGKYPEPRSPVRISSDKLSTSTTSAEAKEAVKLNISAGIWENPKGHRIMNSGRPFAESAGFSFPILAPPPAAKSDDIDPARDSLEVFRPADDMPSLRQSAEFSRRTAQAAAGDDDAASDTSSDLFEIESFSTHSAYRRRDSLDEFPKLVGNAAAGLLQFRRSLEDTAPSIAASECYPPSEVSVEWSVTTAEGGFDRASLANFSSAASDYDEVRFVQTEHDRFGAAMVAGNGGGSKKKGGGGLLSCRSENSVNVGPSPVRIGPEQRRSGNMLFAAEPERGLGMSRFALEKAELVRSHSPRLNLPVQTR